MQFALKTTKTSLYRLVRDRTDLHPPKMRDTYYTKLWGKPSWWLEWYTESEKYSVYFSAVAGRPMLSCCVVGDYGSHQVCARELRLHDLLQRGMLAEATSSYA